MDTSGSTNIQDMIKAGRIVEAGTLLTMHEADLSEEDHRLLAQELHRLQAEAATLVAQAEALEIEGKTAEAMAVYQSVLLFASDYPGVQSQIKELQESLLLTKAVKRRSQRTRQASPIVEQSVRKKPSRSLLGVGLAASTAAALLLLLFLKTPPQQNAAPVQKATSAPAQMAAAQPAVVAPVPPKPQAKMSPAPEPRQAPVAKPNPSTPVAKQARPEAPAANDVKPPPERPAPLPAPSAPVQPAPSTPAQMAAAQPAVVAPATSTPPTKMSPSSEPLQAPVSKPNPSTPGSDQARPEAPTANEVQQPPERPAPLPQAEEPLPQPAALPVSAPDALNSENSYTVQSGDSLSLIAVRLFCHGDAWTHIHMLNREQIADPNKLQPGMVLRLKGIESRCRTAP